jgi:hypothetical protein
MVLSTVPQAQAGEGHDHGDGGAAPSANGPQRLPDGSVFLPKPAQRQLGVRTMATDAELPRSVELTGKVLMDPNAGGKVQPLNAGRIEPGPRGLPNWARRCARARCWPTWCPRQHPSNAPTSRPKLAELRAAKSLADKRVARLKELADTVPRKDIEAAESESASLAERIAAVGGGLSTREALVAPGVRRDRVGPRGGRPGGGCTRAAVRDRRPERCGRGPGLRRGPAGQCLSQRQCHAGRHGKCGAALCGRRPQPARAGAMPLQFRPSGRRARASWPSASRSR